MEHHPAGKISRTKMISEENSRLGCGVLAFIIIMAAAIAMALLANAGMYFDPNSRFF